MHLSADRPEITEQFEQFLINSAPTVGALYILGDLFERWIGDDAAGELEARIAARLHRLVDQGVVVYFLHGNRDFLLGPEYARRAGMQLIEQATVIDLGGLRAVLCHGDQLCTHDAGYQRYRSHVLDPQWQARMLGRPLCLRRALAGLLRQISRWRNRKPAEIRMDVAQSAVERLALEHDAELVIHGHTHRPARHPFVCQGRSVERIVLGDWYSQGSVLIARDGELELRAIERNGHADQAAD